MGIRVHKFLGYGLDDIKHADCWPEDPRINTQKLQKLWDCGTEEYLDWLEKKYEDPMLGEIWSSDRMLRRDYPDRKERDFRFGDCFAYQGKYGLPNVLVVKPLACIEWSRFDDAIDYMEETYLYSSEDGESQISRVQKFDLHGIYPWNGLYMDKRTGEMLKQDAILWVQLHWGTPSEESREKMAELLGFASVAEIEENMVPFVPEEVRDIVEFSSIFTSDDTWQQLRPMLYTYWS